MKTEFEALKGIIEQDLDAAQESYGYPAVSDDHEFRYVTKQEGDEHRWYRDMTTVVIAHHSNNLWAFDWQRPLTELQEGQDEDVSDPYRVEAHEVTTIEYRPSPPQSK